MKYGKELGLAKRLAREAGARILEIYTRNFSVEEKDDGSPLTEADLAANEMIVAGLRSTGIPFLSEESADDLSRLRSDMLWIVDPLDGSKEFVKRNGEFTVNIALAKDGRPVIGVIYAPILDEMYYASDDGAFVEKGGRKQRLHVSGKGARRGMTLVISRSHAGAAEERVARGFGKTVSRGSALKACLVASGHADAYFRSGPTNEWDIAPMDCIVHASGGVMTLLDGSLRTYNSEDPLVHGFLVSNGTIHDELLKEVNDGSA